MGGELFTDFSGSFTDNEYFNKQINVLVRNLTKLRIHPSTPVGESLNKHHGQMHKCLVLVNLKKISADNFALLHTYSR